MRFVNRVFGVTFSLVAQTIIRVTRKLSIRLQRSVLRRDGAKIFPSGSTNSWITRFVILHLSEVVTPNPHAVGDENSQIKVPQGSLLAWCCGAEEVTARTLVDGTRYKR